MSEFQFLTVELRRDGEPGPQLDGAFDRALDEWADTLAPLGSGIVSGARELCFVALHPVPSAQQSSTAQWLTECFADFDPHVQWGSWVPLWLRPDLYDQQGGHVTPQAMWFVSDQLRNGFHVSENPLEILCWRQPGLDIEQFDLLVDRALRSTDAFHLRVGPYRAGEALVALLHPARLLTEDEVDEAIESVAEWFIGYDPTFEWFLTGEVEADAGQLFSAEQDQAGTDEESEAFYLLALPSSTPHGRTVRARLTRLQELLSTYGITLDLDEHGVDLSTGSTDYFLQVGVVDTPPPRALADALRNMPLEPGSRLTFYDDQSGDHVVHQW